MAVMCHSIAVLTWLNESMLIAGNYPYFRLTGRCELEIPQNQTLKLVFVTVHLERVLTLNEHILGKAVNCQLPF